MSRRPALLAAICLALIAAPRPVKPESTNDEVDRRVDEITRSPDYDWLRSQDAAGQNGSTPEGGDPEPGGKRSPIGKNKDPGCGYHRAKQPQSPPKEREAPRGKPSGDCGGGVAPRPPSEGGEGCDCGPAFDACECSRALGSCNCAFPGNLGAALGYLLGGLVLALLVFFVVWIIARRASSGEDAQTATLTKDTDPERVSLSKLPQAPLEQMLQRAEAAARRGDFKRAVGWCYLGGIGRLHRAGLIDLRRSTTNLEIVESVRKKNGPHGQTARLIRVFEDIYFGDRQPTEAHWLESRRIAGEDLA